MADITINEVQYRTWRLNALDQLHVGRRIVPLLTGLGNTLALVVKLSDGQQTDISSEETGQLFAGMGPVANALAEMSDADVNYITKKCLSKVQRYNSETQRWQSLMSGGGDQFMFEDEMNLSVMLQLILEVLKENLGPFLSAILPPPSPQEDQTSTSTLLQ